MNSAEKRKEAKPRRRAIVRLVLGQAQVVGATAALVLVLREGASATAVWAVVLTGVVSLSSILLFRVIWREKSTRKEGHSAEQGIFRWPSKM